LQLVPEERRIFGALTVAENLDIAALSAREPLPFDEIYAIFPRLRERRGSYGRSLSGGEQQMLAIARALIRRPRLILLDEPFEGLAVIIVQNLLEICRELAAKGQTFVIVEQNVRAALSLAHRVYVLNNGHMMFEGTPAALQDAPEVMNRYLGV
ncbi:MAG: ATP-binding cassette domain-containing protein, partial [Xanthobacteraceae bacterium]